MNELELYFKGLIEKYEQYEQEPFEEFLGDLKDITERFLNEVNKEFARF